MIDTILEIIKFETIMFAALFLFPLLIVAIKYPEVVWALGFPTLLFISPLKELVPISTSAICATLSYIAIAGGIFKGYRFRFGRIEKALIILTGLMCLSISYSNSPVYGTEKVLLALGMFLPLVLAASYTLISPEAIKRALNIIGLTFIIYILVSAAVKLSGAEPTVGDRFETLQDCSMAGRYLGLAAIICFYWWCRTGAVWEFIGYFLIAAAILLMFLTGTRTAIAALVGTGIVVEWIREKELIKSRLRKAKRLYLLAIVIFLTLVFGSPLLSAVLPESICERFTSLNSFFNPGDFQEPTSRVLNTVVALEASYKAPLLGVGAGGYKSEFEDYVGQPLEFDDPRHPVYPHNIFLEYLTEQGLAGLILFCYIIYCLFQIIPDVRANLSKLSKQQEQMALTIIAFFTFGFLGAQTALDVPRQHILWWGVGLLIGLPRIQQTGICHIRKTAMRNGQDIKVVG